VSAVVGAAVPAAVCRWGLCCRLSWCGEVSLGGILIISSSPPSRGQASCSGLHGRVTHANSATGLGKLLGTILESFGLYCIALFTVPFIFPFGKDVTRVNPTAFPG